MPDSKIKTLLIEDSAFMRILLSDILRRDESIEIVATANNGLDGVEKVKSFRPHVVITDMVMPQYDGLYVVQELMRDMPLPIILLSSLDRADPKVFDALKEGAFDFLDKPERNSLSTGYTPLTKMIRDASVQDFVKLRQRVKGRNTFVHPFESKLNYDIAVIGASTGGPGAIETILNNLPNNLAIPLVIAQHMPKRFIETFAARLAQTGLNASVPEDQEPLLCNRIYIAPGSANLRIGLTNEMLVANYVNDEYKEFNNPSIDCLFESVAESCGSRTIGAILTGMGRDGAMGLRKIKEAGGLTISQDEASSVVYGMPKVAFESGAARHQMPLQEIPNYIISAL